MTRVPWSKEIVLAVLSLFGVAAADAQITGNSRAAGLEQCVEPTEFMRKNHMDLLIHQRDKTVHQGIRTSKHSLVGCIACHAEREADGSFIAIDAEDQFCQNCHAAVAVDMDCFQCHATKPEVNEMTKNQLLISMAGSYCLP